VWPIRKVESGLQDDRDGPVVGDLDFHARAEDAMGDVDALVLQSSAESFIERLRLLGTSGVREARPVALRGVL
jgi:hypothetical protein